MKQNLKQSFDSLHEELCQTLKSVEVAQPLLRPQDPRLHGEIERTFVAVRTTLLSPRDPHTLYGPAA